MAMIRDSADKAVPLRIAQNSMVAGAINVL